MNATDLELVADQNGFFAYKVCREWKRDLVMTLKLGERKVTVPFPCGKDSLRLDVELVDADCIVSVGQAGFRGLVRGKQDYHVSPRNRTYLISGSGRCGTQAVAQYLDGMSTSSGRALVARHETLYEYLLPLVRNRDVASVCQIAEGMLHDVESAPYYALIPEAIRADVVIHLIRDGRRVVQSGMNRGWYRDNSIWNQIKPVFSADQFENCCHLWRLAAENMETKTSHVFRLEDIVASSDERQRLMVLLDITTEQDDGFPMANQGDKSSDFAKWSLTQRSAFESICGPVMDRYYPGWRDE